MLLLHTERVDSVVNFEPFQSCSLCLLYRHPFHFRPPPHPLPGHPCRQGSPLQRLSLAATHRRSPWCPERCKWCPPLPCPKADRDVPSSCGCGEWGTGMKAESDERNWGVGRMKAVSDERNWGVGRECSFDFDVYAFSFAAGPPLSFICTLQNPHTRPVPPAATIHF